MNIKLGAGLLFGAMALASPWGHTQSLPALVVGVLRTHPSLRAQQALGESAKHALESARWQFYPTPSISFEQVDTGQTDPSYAAYGDKAVTTLRLQQPLWTGGRLTAGLNKAQAGLAVSQATLDALRQDLAVRVVQVYADWLGADLKILAFEKSLKAHRALQDQIDRRIAGGASPRSDLTLLLGRAQQTEADLSAAQAQTLSALGRLSQMVGNELQPRLLEQALGVPLGLASNTQDLLQQAQVHNPGVLKLLAQARMGQGEVAERQADLKPEVYLRAESQHGSYNTPGSPTLTRIFVGVSSHFGAGLSSMTQVSGAQARYQSALAEVDSARLSLAEQIQSDYAQAAAGQVRLLALVAALESSDSIARAWNRQFIAGRKSWLDVMNAVREQTQLETQIADAKSSQLLLSWRLAILGQGLESALALGDAASREALAFTAPARTQTHPQIATERDAAPVQPKSETNESDALSLHMAVDFDPTKLDAGIGASDMPESQENPEGIL